MLAARRSARGLPCAAAARFFQTLLGSAEHVTAPVVQEEFGFTSPTEIQRKAVPPLLAGESVCLTSQTGSGKTLAYLLPLVERLKRTDVRDRRPSRPRALILVPSRGLVHQVVRDTKRLCHAVRVSSVGVVGAQRRSVQRKLLDRPIDVLVGSPGRVARLIEEKLLFTSEVEAAVVDEADTMYEPRADFTRVLAKIFLPVAKRVHRTNAPMQWVLSSASMNADMRAKIQRDFPGMRHVSSKGLHRLSPKLKQSFVDVDPGQNKLDLLVETLRDPAHASARTMVFCNTVPACRAVDHHLQENDFSTSCYHGKMPADLREEEWQRFESGETRILVATDLASRGLDTTYVDRVVNFDFPRNSTDYLHRVGRTARMNVRRGSALSFVRTAAERQVLAKVQRPGGTAVEID